MQRGSSSSCDDGGNIRCGGVVLLLLLYPWQSPPHRRAEHHIVTLAGRMMPLSMEQLDTVLHPTTRIHTFPLGINVWAKCIHSTWIWSTSRMWTNSAKMQWNRWIVKLPLQNPEEVFLKSLDQNYRETFLLQFRAGALPLLWEAIMTVLLVVTPRSFRDGATV